MHDSNAPASSDSAPVTLEELAERVGEAMDRCRGEFPITIRFGKNGVEESYMTHWEKTGIYGYQAPKNVSPFPRPSISEVLKDLDRYVAAYKRPRTHEEGATELVLEDRA
jgi:hypothetical protein